MDFLRQLVDGIAKAWGKLSLSARINIGLAFLGALIVVVALTYWGGQPRYAVLFGNLSRESADSVIAALETRGVPYQTADGGATVLVPSNQVYQLRNQLSGEGAIQGGVVGYELFDQTRLGVTDFVQNIQKQRAIEGELSRTIGWYDAVSSARVHINVPPERLLAAEQREPSAGVLLSLTSPGALGKREVRGIVNLVSASTGIPPSKIAVMDTQRNELHKPSEEIDTVAELADRQTAMIEGRTTTTEDGELQYVALTDDERSQIEGLIVAAVGADLTRGDSVVVYDAQFDTSAEAAAAAAMGEAAREMRRRTMMEAARQLGPAVVVGVALVVLITMLRRLKPMERAARVAVEAEEIRPSDEALAKERMQEEVAKLSQEQPETVANLLKTWLAETE